MALFEHTRLTRSSCSMRSVSSHEHKRIPFAMTFKILVWGLQRLWKSFLKIQNAIEPNQGKQELVGAAYLLENTSQGIHVLRYRLAEGTNRNILLFSFWVRVVVLGSAEEPQHISVFRSCKSFVFRIRCAEDLLYFKLNRWLRFRASKHSFCNPNASFAGL